MPKGVEAGDLTKEEVVRIICAHPDEDLTDRSIIEIAGRGSHATVVKHRRALLKEAAKLLNASDLIPSYLVSAIYNYGKAAADAEQEKCKKLLDDHQKALEAADITISELEAENSLLKQRSEQLAESIQLMTAEKISLSEQAEYHKRCHSEIAAKAETTMRELERTTIRLEAAEKSIQEKAEALVAEKEKLDRYQKAEIELEKLVDSLKNKLTSKEEFVEYLKREKQVLNETLKALKGKI